MSDSNEPAPNPDRLSEPAGKSLLPESVADPSPCTPADLSVPPIDTMRIPDPQPGVGLVVLSAQHTILHTNAEARALLQRLCVLQTPREAGTERSRAFPATVQAVCDEIDRTLRDRSEHNDWLPFEVSRMVGDAREAIMVRAFVFPSRASLSQTRILVTLHTV